MFAITAVGFWILLLETISFSVARPRLRRQIGKAKRILNLNLNTVYIFIYLFHLVSSREVLKFVFLHKSKVHLI